MSHVVKIRLDETYEDAVKKRIREKQRENAEVFRDEGQEELANRIQAKEPTPTDYVRELIKQDLRETGHIKDNLL